MCSSDLQPLGVSIGEQTGGAEASVVDDEVDGSASCVAQPGKHRIETSRGYEVGGEHFTVGILRCDGIEPIFASLMALVLPGLFSVWAAVNYPNERATWTLLVGGALITGANVILQLKPPERAEGNH